jgi:hypothetical protein
MYDLQSYLGKMSAGLISNEKIYAAKYGKPKKLKSRILQPLKLEVPLYEIEESDLP